MFQPDLLKGKRILVTGGGTGLGRSMAHRYLELGGNVENSGRREDVLKQTAEELAKGSIFAFGLSEREHGADIYSTDMVLRPAGDDGAVQVWSASNQQPLGEAMPGRAGAPRSMALSPDGRTIAVAYDSGLIRLWDLASRSAVGGPLEAHPASAEYVAFSPAGDLLASGGADGTIRVWRLPG